MRKLFSLLLALTASATLAFAASQSSSQDVNCGNTATLTATPKAGYQFDHWEVNGSNVSSTNPLTITPTAAVTYKAIFAPREYNITYKDQGNVAFTGTHGSGYPTKHTYGTATPLVSPTKTGYTFNGWFTIAACTGSAITSVGATAYTADFTLYAKWTINSYTISFNSNGGSAVASITQNYGTAVTAPANPTKTGYTFKGWSPAVPTTMPATNTTCVAQWTPTSYSITCNLDGGSLAVANPASYTIESSAITLNNPTKTGYTFAGWTGSNGVTPQTSVTIAAGSTGNKTYTANWTANVYDITYKDQGNVAFTGTHGVGYPTNHTYGTATALVSPTKDGYDFGGWYTNAACTGSAVTSLGATDYTDDITLYAKWTLKTYTIRFYINGTLAETKTVNHGVTPSYTGSTPKTKPADAEYTYEFSHWSPTLYAANKDQDYEAVFTSTKRSYAVRFENWDHSEIQTSNVEYGVSPSKPASEPTRTEVGKTYTFTGWTDGTNTYAKNVDLPTVTGAVTYTAVFSESTDSYLVSVATNDATLGTVVIKKDGVSQGTSGTFQYGTVLTIEATAVDDCREFVSWSDTGAAIHTITVTGGATYTATFQIIQYKVTATSDDDSQGTVTVTIP